VYHLDDRQLTELRPDLILTQELCSVCAPSYTLVQQAAKLLDSETKIVSLEPQGLLDILDNLLLVGTLTGRTVQAEALVGSLRARIERVRSRARGLPAPRVACLEWLDPIYAAGHWVPEMVEIAGGRDILGRSRDPSFIIAWEQIITADPEVVVVMPCGFDVPRTRRELHALTERPGWNDLRAVRNGRVYLTDASAYFNRPGPRIVDGVEILAKILHPEGLAVDLPAASYELL